MTGGRGREGGKRAEILFAAIEQFGRGGYEDTKWADIAAAVGLGPTALYHYFESKQHCLFEIMAEALAESGERFHSLTTPTGDPLAALEAVLADCFDLDEHEMLRNRLLVAEQGLLAQPCHYPREEEARLEARRLTRELELDWARFLGGAMDAGALPPANARLTARAILGLYNSIWLWYRDGGTVERDRMASFFCHRILAMLGADPRPLGIAA